MAKDLLEQEILPGDVVMTGRAKRMMTPAVILSITAKGIKVQSFAASEMYYYRQIVDGTSTYQYLPMAMVVPSTQLVKVDLMSLPQALRDNYDLAVRALIKKGKVK
jgi:hypothetical protein